ncbi:hypothetical protein JVU11DRAFT_1106 [Chiua virens]|nr:hypothetical protein JVU11DRAFT_1106 [Chiua virens]
MYFSKLKKLGPLARGTIYIKLSNFPSHYLVLVITKEDFRYPLISVKVLRRGRQIPPRDADPPRALCLFLVNGICPRGGLLPFRAYACIPVYLTCTSTQ